MREVFGKEVFRGVENNAHTECKVLNMLSSFVESNPYEKLIVAQSAKKVIVI